MTDRINVASLREAEEALENACQAAQLALCEVKRAERTLASIREEKRAKTGSQELEGSEEGLTVETIQRIVASFYGVTIQVLIGPRRRHCDIRPRHVAMYLARELLQHSYPCLGRAFKRDHSTVVVAQAKVDKDKATDSTLEGELSVLRARIMSHLSTHPLPPTLGGADRKTSLPVSPPAPVRVGQKGQGDQGFGLWLVAVQAQGGSLAHTCGIPKAHGYRIDESFRGLKGKRENSLVKITKGQSLWGL